MPTFIHGAGTVLTLNGSDLSAYTNSTDFEDTTQIHDVTCYGASRKAKKSGLGDGKIKCKGVYASDAGGPRGVIKPLKAAGTAVTFVLRPEGTGSGKAQSSVSVIVASYKESLPVAEMISWEAEFEMTGTLNEAAQ